MEISVFISRTLTREFKGADSLKLLNETGKLIKAEGYSVVNIDATIIAQAPKMRPHIDSMRKNIADALEIDINQVNVKASTEEGLGFTGAGLGIASNAIAMID